MDDLVDRLRLCAANAFGDAPNMMREAADELEQLRSRLAVMEVSAENCRRTHVTAGREQP